MFLCRFNDTHLGVVRGDQVFDVSEAIDALPQYRYPLPGYDPLFAHLPQLRERIEELVLGQRSQPLNEVKLESPVANPGKVIAAPVNYQDHIDEAHKDAGIHHNAAIAPIDQAGLFLKASSSVIGTSESIRIRHPGRRTDHEVELAVVIGAKADRVSREDALACVAGYCIGLDITMRGPEDRSMRKSSDTYTVLGPWLATTDEIPDPSVLELSLSLNGDLRQKSSTSTLIMDVPSLIAFASSFYTLMPGDVLLTGTPAGVGPIKSGDILTSRISGIGEMTTLVS